MSFIWSNEEINTMGQTMDAAIKAMDDGLAAEFKKAYVASIDSPEAEEIVNANLGYMSGYYSPDMAKRIMEAYATVHPVFGSSIPTPEEAFNAGVAMAKAATQ